MADVSYIEKINNTKLFAERAGYSRSGKNLDAMVTKVAGATTGNLVSFDANGDFADSHQAAANLVHDASYVHTDNNFTDAEQTKLSGIATGAQVNVIEDVQVNGTSQTVTNKTVDITVPVGGTADPAMDGTASAGSATTWSKSDHVHPTDTSREATANKDSSIPASPVSSHYPSTEAVVQFVNSSVSTNTANFLGTYDVVTDLELTTSATNAQIASALNSYTFPSGTTVTNNDYVFVSINLETTTDVDEYRRFKYSDGTPSGSWAYEYTLNNSSFTQAQWDAINSAITSTKVGNYDTHIANTNNPHGVTKAQVGLGSVGNFLAVSTDANQGLTDTQKVNARANIGAGTYSKPTNGIPSTDMESTVQTSLVLAATAYQKPSGGIPDSDIESAPTWNGKQDSLGINSSTGDAAKFLNERGQFVATSVSVSDNNPTLSWGATSKVGTVGSTDLRVTMPSNPASGKADNIPTFTEASTRVNLNGSNETMPTILGKVKKWFTDLKALAFKATVGTSDIDNDAITAAKVKDNETLPVNVSGTAGEADKVRYQSNEINFANVPTTGNTKHRSWFNYHDGDTNQANPSNPVKSYWFGDRNGKTENTKLVTGGITNKTFIGSSSSVTWNSSVGTGFGCCCIKFSYDLTTGKTRTVVIRLLIDCNKSNGDMCYVDLMLKVQPNDWNSFAIATGRFDTSTNFNLGRIYYRRGTNVYYFAVETGSASSKVTPIIIGSDDESDSDFTTLNVEFGDFNAELASSDWIQHATKRVVYKDIGGTPVGSSSIPTYVDTDGSVNACTPSSMSVGKSGAVSAPSPTMSGSKTGYMLLASVNVFSLDAGYAGVSGEFFFRHNSGLSGNGTLAVSFGEYNDTQIKGTACINYLRAYGTLSEMLKFGAVRKSSTSFELWGWRTGYSFPWVNISAPAGSNITFPSVETVQAEAPTGWTEIPYTFNVTKNTHSSVGSPSIPVYVDSYGQVQPCSHITKSYSGHVILSGTTSHIRSLSGYDLKLALSNGKVLVQLKRSTGSVTAYVSSVWHGQTHTGDNEAVHVLYYESMSVSTSYVTIDGDCPVTTSTTYPKDVHGNGIVTLSDGGSIEYNIGTHATGGASSIDVVYMIKQS